MYCMWMLHFQNSHSHPLPLLIYIKYSVQYHKNFSTVLKITPRHVVLPRDECHSVIYVQLLDGMSGCAYVQNSIECTTSDKIILHIVWSTVSHKEHVLLQQTELAVCLSQLCAPWDNLFWFVIVLQGGHLLLFWRLILLVAILDCGSHLAVRRQLLSQNFLGFWGFRLLVIHDPRSIQICPGDKLTLKILVKRYHMTSFCKM